MRGGLFSVAVSRKYVRCDVACCVRLALSMARPEQCILFCLQDGFVLGA